jgi:hypothetical protein
LLQDEPATPEGRTLVASRLDCAREFNAIPTPPVAVAAAVASRSRRLALTFSAIFNSWKVPHLARGEVSRPLDDGVVQAAGYSGAWLATTGRFITSAGSGTAQANFLA